jgi:hypothetical protein
LLCAAFFSEDFRIGALYSGDTTTVVGGVINGSGWRLAAALVGAVAIVAWCLVHAFIVWGLFWMLDARLGHDNWFFVRGLKKSGLSFGFVEETTFATEQTNVDFVSVGFQDVLADWSPAPGESGFGVSASGTSMYPSVSGKSSYAALRQDAAPQVTMDNAFSSSSSVSSEGGIDREVLKGGAAVIRNLRGVYADAASFPPSDGYGGGQAQFQNLYGASTLSVPAVYAAPSLSFPPSTDGDTPDGSNVPESGFREGVIEL